MCEYTQYIGESKNSLKTRFYQHRSNINKDTGTLVTKHFNQKGHSLKNLKSLPIESLWSEPWHQTETGNILDEQAQNGVPSRLNTLD